MMSFADLEQQRNTREELELIEAGLVERLQKTPEILGGVHRSRRIGALASVEARKLLDRYKEVYAQLKPIKFETLDNDAAIKAYNEPDMILPSVNRYSLLAQGMQLDQYKCAYTKDLNIDLLFTPSENYGQFFDLHSQYARYVAIKGKPMTYLEYLECFPQFDATQEYMSSVDEYLRDFFDRVFCFEDKPNVMLDDPLYCTACQRQFTTSGVYNGHIEGKKHKRAVSGGKPQPDAHFLKKRITKYMELLDPVLQQTITDVKRQSFLTENERKAEVEITAKQREAEDQLITHPLSLASMPTSTRERIGPDGKPIPQWLYKLKGLGHEFKCEICGNYTYNGRYAFERHFDEARHVHGLSCLGVDARPLYRGLTSIQDVLELVAKQNKAREDAEVEDDEGNVMTERVYRDLKNQGLI